MQEHVTAGNSSSNIRLFTITVDKNRDKQVLQQEAYRAIWRPVDAQDWQSSGLSPQNRRPA